MDASFQVGPNTVVLLSYRGYDGDGEQLSDDPLRADFVFGFGQLPERVERALDGLVQGRSVKVRLEASEAFGERDLEAVVEVDRSELPEDAAPGDVFEAEDGEGQIVALKVLEVTDDLAVLDLNHPLAGQPMSFELTVLGVRPATEAEIATALASMERPVDGLVPVSRLLCGPSGR